MSTNKNHRQLVTCSVCGKTWSKRKDSLKGWKGRCEKCALTVRNKSAKQRTAVSRNAKAILSSGKVYGGVGKRGEANHRYRGVKCIDCGGPCSAGKVKRCAACQVKFRVGANHWNWRGGKTGYPEEWGEPLRRAIKTRDKYRCQNCGVHRNKRILHVHHINENKSDCNPDNLITLCTVCHQKHHKHRYRVEVLLGVM